MSACIKQSCFPVDCGSVVSTRVGLLARNRRAMDVRLRGTRWRPWISPVILGLSKSLERAIGAHGKGDGLDLGAGASPYRGFMERSCDVVHTLDIEQRGGALTYVGDIQSMPQVPSARYDTVLCSEVLEHIARPDVALAEIHRVLRPAGCMILSVPFLSRLHEEPHDYWRFTEHGLRELLLRSGFSIDELRRIGGPASFAGHQLSSMLLLPLWGIRMLRGLALLANAAFIVAPSRLIDAIPGVARKFPAGYVVVAHK